MADDPYRYFRVEAQELLGELVKGVLDLERGAPVPEATAGLLRHAHTLKGAARVIKQPEIADHAHAIEETLEPFREAVGAIPEDRLEIVLGLLDLIRNRVAALPSPDDAPRAETESPQPEGPVRTIRADVVEMDVLLDGVGQAHARLGALRTTVRSVERARGLADLVVSELATTRTRAQRHAGRDGRVTRAGFAAEELRAVLGALGQSLESGVEQIDRELRQVRDALERLRLAPASLLFTDLERAARDVAQAQGKRVSFAGRGGDVRLDAHVLAAAQTALHQIVRNAVAHGLETEAERRAAGKSPEGHVTLVVARRGRNVAFSCRDDGRGVDLEAVRRAAQRKGLLSPETGSLGSEELTRLLLRGGISTSGAVTELSGRGIGLDVVRDSAARLGGEVTVTTEPGRGTTVELEVPLSLAAIEALAVEAGGVTALIPLDAVARTARVGRDELHAGAQGEALAHEGAVVPFLRLSAALSGGSVATSPEAVNFAVIVAGQAGAAAIGVHRLLGTSSIVVRPVPEFVRASPILAGVWLDPEGTPQLLLDPDGLVAEARIERAPVAGSGAAEKAPILVVDDSLTTRMLEQSILESAGYDVHVASSGEEALAKALATRYLLMLVDVEMPGMDGFTFVERARADPSLCDVPAILVTSRAAPEDRQRGMDAGASAYITKGDFNQGRLLERIRALTAR